jgi:hypothetical protein
MRILGTVVVALLFATAAQAQDLDPRQEVPAEEVSAEAPAIPEVPAIAPRLADEPRAAPEPGAIVADPFTRGSFWWYVGIIVVAGVILAVIL